MANGDPTYKIVRFFKDEEAPRHQQVQHRGLSLEDAKEHCNDPETSSSTCTSALNKQRTKTHGPWFDGYTIDG